MLQKGFTQILILLVAIVLLVVGWFAYMYFVPNKNSIQNPQDFSSAAPSVSSSSPVPSPSPSTNPQVSSGLVVVRKGVDGENFARELASQKKWGFITVETADPQQIREAVQKLFHQTPFEYLLLIGTNEEIPYAVYDSGTKLYKTDPTLYGDMDNTGLVDLAVGRLPFSSKDQLQKYFSDLGPKGDTITFDNYPFTIGKIEPNDSFLVHEYSYVKACIVPFSSSFRAFQMPNPTTLVQHYYNSAVIELRTHGSDEGISPTTNRNEWPPILTFDAFKDTSGNARYFDNRPIIVHMSCNNAKVLGQQFIENGASAFLGFYNPSGYAPMATQQLLAGKPVGEAMKDMNNEMILRFARINDINKSGLYTFDLTDKSITPTLPIDTYGFVLYGDPSLKLSDSLQKKSSIQVNNANKKLTISVLPASKFDATSVDVPATEDVLCYMGSEISDPSFVGKEIWNKNHFLQLGFPVQGIHRLLSYAIYIGSQKQETGEDTVNTFGKKIPAFPTETINIALIKGKETEYINVFVNDYKGTSDSPPSRFDNSKELKIIIDYE